MWRPHFHFWWILDRKYCRSNLLVYQGLQIGKNTARQYFIFIVMFVVGYYNEYTVVWRQNICQFFFKDSWVNQNIFHMINRWSMLMVLNVLSIFKLILIISRHYFTIEIRLDMRYNLSRSKHNSKVFPSIIRGGILLLSHIST